MAKTYAQLRKGLESFLEHHLRDLENDERVEALTWYCQGLGLEIPFKTALGIAKRLDPDNVQATRQRMQRALAKGRFSHEEVFARIQATVFEEPGRLTAYCIDDTGFAKKGEHSVGVQRQYSGTLGKVGNCQVATSLHGVSSELSVCLAGQLYLSESWTEDEERRENAQIPKSLEFATKPQIAVELLKKAKANGAPRRPVVADAGYGDSREFRDAIRRMDWHYAVAISSNTTVWPPGAKPVCPPSTGKRGRPRTRDRDMGGAEPIRVDVLAAQLWEQDRFKPVIWGKGQKGDLEGLFCAVRIHSAEGRIKGKSASEEIWLLLERDESQPTGFKYYLSSLAKSTSLRKLVALVKVRWRIERDYQDMKQKLGLDAYEGRSWGGFHHHFAMVALVHAFVSLYREAFSPSGHGGALELGRLLPSFGRGPNTLDRPLPNLSSSVR